MKYYSFTPKGVATLAAINAGLIPEDKDGNLSSEHIEKFDKFWDEICSKGITYPSSYAKEMFRQKAERKRAKRKFYLENTFIMLGAFILGCLIKSLLTG